MSGPILLDTCTAIWLAAGEQVSAAAVEALNAAADAGAPALLSPITAWEVGLLVSRGRLQILMTPQRWFARLVERPTVRLADMSPELLIASSFLPGNAPRDPADRIIVATAREYGATLVTRDRVLLNYGEQGHVATLAC